MNGNNSPGASTSDRHYELLQLARRSRTKWILDARDTITEDTNNDNDNTINDINDDISIGNSIGTTNGKKSLLSEALRAKVPALDCVQQVINYLCESTGDGEVFDVDSIAMTLMEYDELDDELDQQKETGNCDNSAGGSSRTTIGSGGSMQKADSLLGDSNPYNAFLKKLLHPNASEVVKSMQHYVTRYTTQHRLNKEAMYSSDNGYNNSNNDNSASSADANATDDNDVSKKINENNVEDNYVYDSDSIYAKQRSSNPTNSSNTSNSHSHSHSYTHSNTHNSTYNESNTASVHEKNADMNIFVFLENTYELMRQSLIWKYETEEQFSISKTSCEKFLFKKLYPIIFNEDEDVHNLNSNTIDRIKSLSFLTPEHLDIKTISFKSKQDELNKLSKAINYINQLNNYCSPTEKLLCIKNCSIAIATLLINNHKKHNKDIKNSTSTNNANSNINANSNDSGSSNGNNGTNNVKKNSKTHQPGADELLPMMILCIKNCNNNYIHSNIKFLQRYLHPNLLVSEAGYILTNFVSAVFFLDNVDAKALTIDPEEFDKAIISSKKRAKEIVTNERAKSSKKLLLKKSDNIKDIHNDLYDEISSENINETANKSVDSCLNLKDFALDLLKQAENRNYLSPTTSLLLPHNVKELIAIGCSNDSGINSKDSIEAIKNVHDDETNDVKVKYSDIDADGFKAMHKALKHSINTTAHHTSYKRDLTK